MLYLSDMLHSAILDFVPEGEASSQSIYIDPKANIDEIDEILEDRTTLRNRKASIMYQYELLNIYQQVSMTLDKRLDIADRYQSNDTPQQVVGAMP
jgi:hypothetical protein